MDVKVTRDGHVTVAGQQVGQVFKRSRTTWGAQLQDGTLLLLDGMQASSRGSAVQALVERVAA